MKKTEKFLLSGVMLAATTLFMRLVSVVFNVYVTNKIGSAGMGLITLINSVYGFAVTFATSGINLSATRMCAEALGRGSDKELKGAMSKCIIYALSFGVSAMLLLFFLAEPIGFYWLKDERTVLCLKCLSIALPFIALSSAFNGYFTAVRRVYKNASAVIIEQGIKIFITINALSVLLPRGIEYSCIAVIGGGAVAEMTSFAYYLILFIRDKKKHIGDKGDKGSGLGKRLLGIALPVAMTAYVRSGLLTVEHALIPIGLKKNGATATGALSIYGTIHAMVFPIVLFPQAVLAAFNGLVIPEFSESLARNDRGHINRVANKVIKTTAVFASLASVLVFSYADELGNGIYNSAGAASYIRIFSLLIPVMYIDSAVDSILKGMGEQVYSMKVNILDAAVSTVLVYLLLPVWGIMGYVFIIFFCELMNTVLSGMKLKRIVSLKINWLKGLFLPLFSACGGVMITKLLTYIIPVMGNESGLATVVKMTLSLAMAVVFLFTTGSISPEEITSLISFRRKKPSMDNGLKRSM